MWRRSTILGAVAALIAAACSIWWLSHRRSLPDALTLYGNVDLRQVDLPFNGSERIAAVLAEEGDRVRKGQLLARLDTSRLAPQVAQVEAQAAAQRAVVERMHHGSRPEEIAQARANLAQAEAPPPATGTACWPEHVSCRQNPALKMVSCSCSSETCLASTSPR